MRPISDDDDDGFHDDQHGDVDGDYDDDDQHDDGNLSNLFNVSYPISIKCFLESWMRVIKDCDADDMTT